MQQLEMTMTVYFEKDLYPPGQSSSLFLGGVCRAGRVEGFQRPRVWASWSRCDHGGPLDLHALHCYSPSQQCSANDGDTMQTKVV